MDGQTQPTRCYRPDNWPGIKQHAFTCSVSLTSKHPTGEIDSDRLMELVADGLLEAFPAVETLPLVENPIPDSGNGRRFMKRYGYDEGSEAQRAADQALYNTVVAARERDLRQLVSYLKVWQREEQEWDEYMVDKLGSMLGQGSTVAWEIWRKYG